MAVISVEGFGGMLPSANPQLIPDTKAVYVSNFDVRYQDLRPTIAPAVVTTASAGGTLYKFSNSNTFITKPGDVNFVRGPIPNDTTERTYFTGDGVPKVTDLSLAVRQLGVPKPTVAPSVVKTVMPTFTTENAAAAIAAAPDTILTAVKAILTVGYEGLADADLTDLTPSSGQGWSYLVARPGTLSSGVFTPTTASDICLAHPDLEYTTTSNMIYVPLFVRGRRWRADPTTLSNAIKAIPTIDITDSSGKMFTTAQADALATVVQTALASRDSEIWDIQQKIKARKVSFMALLNDPSKVTALLAGAMAAYYAGTSGSTALTNAINSTAQQIVDTAQDNAAGSITLSAATTGVTSYILTNPNGVKTVDSTPMIQWVYTKIKRSTPVAGETGSIYSTAANIVAIFSNALAEIAKNALEATNSNSSPYEAVTRALIGYQADMESYVKQLEDIALDVTNDKLRKAIKSYFDSKMLSSMPAGKQSIITARAYVLTEVTDWGEESAPSPVSNIVEVDQNDVTTVTLPAAPTGRNIAKRRVYRSATGSSTSAFLFHSEVTWNTGGIIDTTPDDMLGEACPTFGWDEPPAGLTGLVGMPNGIMLGFTGDTLHASEPYAPYAYPAKYDISLEYPIVGIAVAGQTAVVTTKGVPYLVTGVDSMSLTAEKIPVNQACVAKRSMVAIGGAVIYASADGLVLVEGGNASLITEGLLSKKDWALYNPTTIRAAEYEGRYCAFCNKTTGGTTTPVCLVFDMIGKSLTESSVGADAVFTDKATDTMYTLSGTNIYDYFPVTGTKTTGTWRSKDFTLPQHSSFGWLFVDAEFGSVTVKLYTGATLLATLVVTSKAPVRVPFGRYKEWQFEITSNVQVTRLTLATSTQELQGVV